MGDAGLPIRHAGVPERGREVGRDAPRANPTGEVVMPVIVVTRLRLKDPALLDDFFTAAVASLEQAKASEGGLGTNVLADANNAWWTLTAWQERRRMHAFVGSEPHRSTMARLDDWCDEATFADWEQDSPDLPDWQTSHRRLVADGLAASLTQPSDAHQTRAFPPPVESPGTAG
jgi:hypothetical protein